MSTQICGECQKTFIYPNNEYNRRIKKGITTFFCSLSCSSTYRNKNRSPELQKKINEGLRGNKNGRGNYKGKFTYYLRKAKERSRNRFEEPDIDQEYLESIWTGKCVYTNLPIILAQSSTQFETPSLYNASLDRIDSSKGYIKGNVQWVCLGINYAKNGFSHEEMIDFVNRVVGQSQVPE